MSQTTGTAHHPEHNVSTEKHGFGRIVPWGSFISAGTGKLAKVNWKLDEAKYDNSIKRCKRFETGEEVHLPAG